MHGAWGRMLLLCICSALGIAACTSEAPSGNGVARGAFVMYVDGAVQDTVRGAAYLRDTTSTEPGLELDADSIGWSVHWMRSETPAPTYTLVPHALMQAVQKEATDDAYRPAPRVTDPLAASLFMAYGTQGTFEAQAGTLHVERATPTDHVGRVHATLTLRGQTAPRVTVQGHWHAVPAPDELPSHVRSQ